MRIYDWDKDLLTWSDITIALYLETLFKAFAHPLTKGDLWVKYEPDYIGGICKGLNDL